jgi:16S rRNA processing protein RimM
VQDHLVIGILQAPYGLKGELKVRSLSGETDHFFRLEGRSVALRPVVDGRPGAVIQERAVESVRVVEPHLLVKFAGFDSPEKARALTGCELLVPRSQASGLDDGEYYVADLVGCGLVYKGAVLGTVKSVWESGAHEMLEVRIDDPGAEKGWRVAQVPFREPFIGAVDVQARSVELLVDWILE